MPSPVSPLAQLVRSYSSQGAAPPKVRVGALRPHQRHSHPPHEQHVKAAWDRYFANTTAETARAAPVRGITANVDAAFDSVDHDFVTDPVLGQVHRVLEMTKADPFLALHSAYMAETDPAKAAKMRATLDAVAPVEAMTAEQAMDSLRINYPFLKQGKH